MKSDQLMGGSTHWLKLYATTLAVSNISSFLTEFKYEKNLFRRNVRHRLSEMALEKVSGFSADRSRSFVPKSCCKLNL